MTDKTPEQIEFETKYITSSDICCKLGVSRTSIFQARQRGLLPAPIIPSGSNIAIWRRADIDHILKAWTLTLAVRKGEMAPAQKSDAV